MTVLLQLRDAHMRYGEQVLLDGAECSITDDYKTGFIGRNGAGKSTLCRILLGEEQLDSGEVIRHPKLRLGYLRQHDPFLPLAVAGCGRCGRVSPHPKQQKPRLLARPCPYPKLFPTSPRQRQAPFRRAALA